LTGEVYSNNHDPQEKTDVQRTWLYSSDPAVAALNKRPDGPNGPPTNLKALVLPYDNQTSLPMGEGMQAMHPKSGEPGFYRRIRTDITIIKNNVITRK
jgi:hypothetical protein